MESQKSTNPIMDEEDVHRALIAEKNRLRAALSRANIHLMAGEIDAAKKEIKEALYGSE